MPQPKFSIVQEVEFAQAATQLREGRPIIVEFPDREMKATITPTTGFQPEGEPAFPQVYKVKIDTDGELTAAGGGPFTVPEDAIDVAVTYLRDVAL